MLCARCGRPLEVSGFDGLWQCTGCTCSPLNCFCIATDIGIPAAPEGQPLPWRAWSEALIDIG